METHKIPEYYYIQSISSTKKQPKQKNQQEHKSKTTTSDKMHKENGIRQWETNEITIKELRLKWFGTQTTVE